MFLTICTVNERKLVRIDSKFRNKVNAVFGAPDADCRAILSISVTYTARVTHSSLGSMKLCHSTALLLKLATTERRALNDERKVFTLMWPRCLAILWFPV